MGLHQVISEAELPESQRQDLLAIAAFFLCRHFDMSEIKEVFDMETIEKNPLGEYLLNKGFEKGIEQGIEQGIEKGQKRTQIKLTKTCSKTESKLKKSLTSPNFRFQRSNFSKKNSKSEE